MILRRSQRRAARDAKQERAKLRESSLTVAGELRAQVEALRAENARLSDLVAAAVAFQFWGGTMLCPRRAKVYLFESPSGATWWAIDLRLGVDGSRIEARDDLAPAIEFAKARVAGEPE